MPKKIGEFFIRHHQSFFHDLSRTVSTSLILLGNVFPGEQTTESFSVASAKPSIGAAKAYPPTSYIVSTARKQLELAFRSAIRLPLPNQCYGTVHVWTEERGYPVTPIQVQ
jgi:hypothetical protein